MNSLAFSKYSGCGNDFVLVDNRSSLFPTDNAELISRFCHRRDGIGADGVILLENSSKADFRMRIFNANGSEAEMCGNGIRCLMLFIHRLYPSICHCTVQTTERMISLELIGELVKAAVGDPTDLRWNLEATVGSTPLMLHALNTGVPHCVLYASDIDTFDLKDIGPKLRHSPLFGCKGTNVNVAQPAEGRIRYRTFERGVEDETPACGTGAVAVALATAYQMHWPSPITVQTSSDQHLLIEFKRCEDTFTDVFMTGPATHSFDGTVNIK